MKVSVSTENGLAISFTPVIGITLGSSPLAVKSLTLGTPNSHGVTGGVYKTRERIHPDMLIRDY